MCLLAICMSSLEKCLSSAHFFFFFFWLDHLLRSCISYLYIFEIKPLLVALFANILSYKLSFFLFFFFMVSFLFSPPLLCSMWEFWAANYPAHVSQHWCSVPRVQILSVWLGPICLFLLLFIFVLGYWPGKTLLWFMSETILPMFSSKSFMVSCLIFRYLSHF